MQDIEKEKVNFKENYEGREKEKVVMKERLKKIIVNG